MALCPLQRMQCKQNKTKKQTVFLTHTQHLKCEITTYIRIETFYVWFDVKLVHKSLIKIVELYRRYKKPSQYKTTVKINMHTFTFTLLS